MITQAMLKFLRQVDATGSAAGKHAVVTAAEKRGYIERDRVEGYRVLYRLTINGKRALARAKAPDEIKPGSKEHLDWACNFLGI